MLFLMLIASLVLATTDGPMAGERGCHLILCLSVLSLTPLSCRLSDVVNSSAVLVGTVTIRAESNNLDLAVLLTQSSQIYTGDVM